MYIVRAYQERVTCLHEPGRSRPFAFYRARRGCDRPAPPAESTQWTAPLTYRQPPLAHRPHSAHLLSASNPHRSSTQLLREASSRPPLWLPSSTRHKCPLVTHSARPHRECTSHRVHGIISSTGSQRWETRDGRRLRGRRVSDRWLPGRHGLSTSETLTTRLWKASERGHKYLVGHVEWVLVHERARPASRDSEHGFSQGESQRDAHGPDE